MDNIFSLVIAFFGIVIVLLLTYYSTRYIAKHFNGFQKTKNLQLLEKLPLGKDKSIAIINIKDKTLLIGISEHNVTLLTELSNFPVEECKIEQPVDFNTILMKNLKEKLGFKNREDDNK